MSPPLYGMQIVDKVFFILSQVVPILDEELFLLRFQSVSLECAVDNRVDQFRLFFIGKKFLRVLFVLSFEEIEGLFERVRSFSLEVWVIDLKAVIEVGALYSIDILTKEVFVFLGLLVGEQDRVWKFGELNLQKSGRN